MTRKSDLAHDLADLMVRFADLKKSVGYLYKILDIDPRKARWMVENRTDPRVQRSLDLAAGLLESNLSLGVCGMRFTTTFPMAPERCGLLAGHAGRHISFPSGIVFGHDDPIPPADPCGVTATTCMYHDPAEPRDCPRTGHDHPACEYERGHTGIGRDRHSWQDIDDDRPTTDPHAPKPVTYAIPGMPPVGRTVAAKGNWWRILADGSVECISGHAKDTGVTMDWVDFLAVDGPAELVELTDEERASEALYGPVGMRWADPDGPPCPYVDGDRECWMRVGHGGPHVHRDGLVLGLDSTVDGPTSVLPWQAAETPCTCGRPDQHQPGCPRYQRMRHADPGYGTFPHGLDEEPF